MDHNVTLKREATEDETGNGIGAILRAFMKNPVAAAEIIMFIGGAYGIWYTTNSSIADAKATSEQHYKDLSADLRANNEKVIAGLDALRLSDAAEVSDIKSLFQRGDQRYALLVDRLAAVEVRFARLEDSSAYTGKQLDAIVKALGDKTR